MSVGDRTGHGVPALGSEDRGAAPGNDDSAANGEADAKQWPDWATATLALLKRASRRVRGFVAADPGGAAALAASTAAALLAAIVVIAAFCRIVLWLATGNPLRDVGHWVAVSRIATDAIARWLSVHTAGLALTPGQAAGIWSAIAVLVFFAACCRHRGAQMLWVGFGACTAAMAWQGTAVAEHRPIVVGLVGSAWALLSLAGLRGPRARNRPRVILWTREAAELPTARASKSHEGAPATATAASPSSNTNTHTRNGSSEMNIYYVTRDEDPGYDELSELAVVAESKEDARKIAVAEAGDESPDVWEDEETTRVVLMGTADPSANRGAFVKDNFEHVNL